MKLIFGLGNPGKEHERDRHNVGFWIVDGLADRAGATFANTQFQARVAQGNLGGERVFFLKPQTFMNRSGQSVQAAARFYKVSPGSILVIHDELDLPFGRIQLKPAGGSGGHNGLKSVLESLGEDGFARLRFGIGKPTTEGPERVVGHVLSGFSRDERAALPERLEAAILAAQTWAVDGLDAAMNRFNRR